MLKVEFVCPVLAERVEADVSVKNVQISDFRWHNLIKHSMSLNRDSLFEAILVKKFVLYNFWRKNKLFADLNMYKLV